ncbi:MAG: NEW3 domain-containing protein, partial [Candidatus Poseidoniia archaeon]|nr:NEW3 domain-containing protein [Candidatus Poseidoniia archaeon]
KTVGSIVDPADSNLHPLLPSLLLADFTDDSGTEIIVPRPAPEDSGDSSLHVYQLDGTAAADWGSSYTFSDGGDMDATPAIGDVDGDGDLELVAVTWLDPSATTNTEETHVWALESDRTQLWHTTYDTSSGGGGWDDDEHAISSPILAVINTEDSLGSDNWDVFSCTTPECFALDGSDGRSGGGGQPELWHVTLENRENSNRIFNSPAASDVDGDGLLDLIVDGSVWSADLADLAVYRDDITITNSDDDEVDTALEGEELTFFPLTVRNEGNHDALDMTVEVRLDDPASGELLHEEQELDIDANSVLDLTSFDWTAPAPGDYRIWVVCVIDADSNEEVRYDNNNASRPLTVRPQYGVALAAANATQDADPGASVGFSVTLRNSGVVADNYTITATLPAGWSGSWPANASDVAPNGTVALALTVDVNGSATAGEHLVTLTATSQGDANASASLALRVNVSQHYGVALELPVVAQRVFPDTWVSYPVRVTNSGNGNDTFDLFTGTDWQAQIRIGGAPAGQVSLGPGATAQAELRLRPPAEAGWNESREIFFTATSQGNSSHSATVVTNTSVGGMMAASPVAGALPGGVASFRLELANLGDSSDDFELALVAGDPGWEQTLEPASLTLAADEHGFAWLNFTIPREASPGTAYNLTLRASSSSMQEQVALRLEVLAPSGLGLWPLEEGNDRAFVDPGATAFFDLQVLNHEDTALDVSLAATLPAGWSGSFDNASGWSKSVPAGGSATVSLGITAPDDAEAVETAHAVIEATSGSRLARFHANITVNQDFGVAVAMPPEAKLLGNVSTTLRFTVTNNGNGADSLEITVGGAWVSGSTEALSFAPFESRELTVIANPGMEAPGTLAQLTVDARSLTADEAGLDVTASNSSALVATGLQLLAAPEGPVAPGETVQFLLGAVALYDPGSATTRLVVEAQGDDAGWATVAGIENFEGRDTLIVKVGVPEIVTVNVTVPADASAGAHAITLRVEDNEEPAHVSTVALEFEVSQSHGLELLLVSGPATVAPGGEANWLVDLRNSGNGNDSASFTLEGLPAGWNASFTPDNATLGAGASAAIGLRVSVGSDATAGNHGLTLVAQGAGANTSLPLELNVSSTRGVSLVMTDSASQSGRAGQTVFYRYTVTNSGNAADTIELDASGLLATQGSAVLDWTVATLGAGVEKPGYLRITVPDGSGPWSGTISARSSSDPAVVDTVALTLASESVSDAYLEELRISPSSPEEGDRVTASVTVLAGGTDLESVYVGFYLDGTFIGGERVNQIAAGWRDKVVTVSFDATGGSHHLEAVIDPDNEVAESDESNNELELAFTVDSGSGRLPFYLLFVALAAVGGAVYYRYRNRDRKPALPQRPGPKLADEPSVKFPLVLNCQQCGSRVRVPRPGAFRCPACKHVARVEPHGAIVDHDAPRAEAPAGPPPEEPPAPAAAPQVDAAAEAPAPETAAPAAPPNERSARMAAFFGDASSPSPPPRAPSAADPRSRDERLAELRAAPPAEPEPEAAAEPAVPAAPEPEPPVEAEAAPAAEEAEPEPKKPKKKGPRDFGPSIGGLG